LGLATIQGIVQRHDGSLHIDTEENAGTTFTISFPLAKSAEASEQSEKTCDLGVLKILVVEDEESQRDLLKELLGSEGHEVDTASEGLDALKKFNAGWYDLVITDRAMPQMNGDQLAKQVKKTAPQKAVIMLTGFGDMMDAAGESPQCVDLTISKPITKEKLVNAIGQLIGK